MATAGSRLLTSKDDLIERRGATECHPHNVIKWVEWLGWLAGDFSLWAG